MGRSARGRTESQTEHDVADVSGTRRILLVASTGGHLAQLARLAPGLGASDSSEWVTFRSAQSESLLAGRSVHYVPYIAPRAWISVLRAVPTFWRLVRKDRFDLVVSTGAAVALAALPIAKLRRVPALYIESVSRTHGPSLTGRVIAAINAAETRTQHREWASEKWGVHDSVLGTYRAVPKRPAKRPRLFVTLGTIEGYRFDALVDAIVATGLADEFTVWQLGETERVDLPGRVTTQISAQEFETAAREADVVVSHAGVGSLLNLLDWGIRPVLVPRRSSRREHVDDHQEQIAELARERDVAEVVEVGDLTAANLWAASGRRIEAAIR